MSTAEVINLPRESVAPEPKVGFSVFGDVNATKPPTEYDLTLAELAAKISATRKDAKAELPLIKLATFGDVLSEKGSYRHDANVHKVFGLECDYDAERMPFEDAVERVRRAGVEAIVHTSPSHTLDRPRWRVLFWFAASATAAEAGAQ